MILFCHNRLYMFLVRRIEVFRVLYLLIIVMRWTFLSMIVFPWCKDTKFVSIMQEGDYIYSSAPAPSQWENEFDLDLTPWEGSSKQIYLLRH